MVGAGPLMYSIQPPLCVHVTTIAQAWMIGCPLCLRNSRGVYRNGAVDETAHAGAVAEGEGGEGGRGEAQPINCAEEAAFRQQDMKY